MKGQADLWKSSATSTKILSCLILIVKIVVLPALIAGKKKEWLDQYGAKNVIKNISIYNLKVYYSQNMCTAIGEMNCKIHTIIGKDELHVQKKAEITIDYDHESNEKTFLVTFNFGKGVIGITLSNDQVDSLRKVMHEVYDLHRG